MDYVDDRAGLVGKVAVVLGGGGGLGRASALELGRAGMAVELADRHEERLAETLKLLDGEDITAFGQSLDVRAPDELAAFVSSAAARHEGRFDVLVNVVGGTFRQPFLETKPKGWDALIRTNFTWILHAVQLGVPCMSSGGSIINFTSIEAHRAAPGFAVYGAMKAAVTSLTRTLAVELGPLGIRINAIAADAIATAGLEGIAEQRTPQGAASADAPTPGDTGDRSIDGSDERLSRTGVVPLAREGTPPEVGSCVLFLASDLSSYLTGQTLHPDGGALAGSGWWRIAPGDYRTHPHGEPPEPSG